MKAITSRVLLSLSLISGLVCSASAYATPITDIAILMDASGSMGRTGWDNEEDFVSNFILDGIPYEHSRLGIIQFSSSSRTKQIYGFEDQQDDRELIADVVQNMSYTKGSTYMKKAIDKAINLFDNESAEENNKAIIMLTDGNPWPSSRQDPCGRASALDARGIDVFIVGMGNGWTRDRIDCLVEDPYLDIIATAGTSADDLAAAMTPLTERIGAISGIEFTNEMTCNEAGAIWDSNRCRAAWPSTEPEPVSEPTTFFSMIFGLIAMLFMRRYRHKLQFKQVHL